MVGVSLLTCDAPSGSTANTKYLHNTYYVHSPLLLCHPRTVSCTLKQVFNGHASFSGSPSEFISHSWDDASN